MHHFKHIENAWEVCRTVADQGATHLTWQSPLDRTSRSMQVWQLPRVQGGAPQSLSSQE